MALQCLWIQSPGHEQTQDWIGVTRLSGVVVAKQVHAKSGVVVGTGDSKLDVSI